MYVKSKNNVLIKYPYTFDDYKHENPYTNPATMNLLEAFIGTEENLNGHELNQVETMDQPVINAKTQKVFLSETPSYRNGRWVLEWVIIDKTQDEINIDLKTLETRVRQFRNELLSLCDWRVLPDATGDKDAWAVYRQALRDITNQDGFPNDVKWPKQPSV